MILMIVFIDVGFVVTCTHGVHRDDFDEGYSDVGSGANCNHGDDVEVNEYFGE